MSTDNPAGREDGEPAIAQPAIAQPTIAQPAIELSGLDDEGLLAALREVIGHHHQPPPDWSADLAKSSYDLREADAHLAALISDSGLATAQSVVRSGAAPRLAVFDTGDLSVEIEIERGTRAGSWRLIGQLIPAAPARIKVRQQRAEPCWADADDRGRFAVDHLGGGPLSLICMRAGMPAAVTEWIAIG